MNLEPEKFLVRLFFSTTIYLSEVDISNSSPYVRKASAFNSKEPGTQDDIVTNSVIPKTLNFEKSFFMNIAKFFRAQM